MPGGAVAEDELTLVSHIVTPDVLGRDGSTAYLGHLIVEPRRHAPGLGDLTDAEARTIGLWCSRASRALREVAGAEHVYAAAIGDAVPHLHIHLITRFPGTPREYWWTRVEEWPQARRGDVTEIAGLVAGLAATSPRATRAASPCSGRHMADTAASLAARGLAGKRLTGCCDARSCGRTVPVPSDTAASVRTSHLGPDREQTGWGKHDHD